MSAKDPDLNHYISREEFEGFERSVSKSFESVGKNFESVGETLRDIRADIQRLSTRGTDWKAIFAGCSLLLAVIVAVGGVIAWGQNEKMNFMSERITVLEDWMMRHAEESVRVNARQDEALRSIDQLSQSRHEMQDLRLDRIEKILEKLQTP